MPETIDHRYMSNMEARIAVLEQIAHDTRETLVEMRQDVRELRSDIKDIRVEQKNDFRLLFGALISLALGLSYLMARGFHWL